jgi:hypothetical protein
MAPVAWPFRRRRSSNERPNAAFAFEVRERLEGARKVNYQLPPRCSADTLDGLSLTRCVGPVASLDTPPYASLRFGPWGEPMKGFGRLAFAAGVALALQACATYSPATFSKAGVSAAAHAHDSKQCTEVAEKEAKSKEEFVKRQQATAVIGGGLAGAMAVSGDDPYGIKAWADRMCMEKRGYCSDTPPSWRSKSSPPPAHCKW